MGIDQFRHGSSPVTGAVWPISHANSSLVAPCPQLWSPVPLLLTAGSSHCACHWERLCHVGEGKEDVREFPVASDPVSHIKNHIGYTGKGSVLQTFHTGHVLEAEI